MKKSQPSVPTVSVPSILRAVRTAHAKAVRRVYGDRGGIVGFQTVFCSLLQMVVLTQLLVFRKITSY